MTFNGWFQIALYLLAIFAIAKPLSVFMALSTRKRRQWGLFVAEPRVNVLDLNLAFDHASSAK